MLTLAGAVASLGIMLLVLGEPALRACVSDARGTVACLRDAALERLNLPVVAVPTPTEVASTPAVVPELAPSTPAVPATPPAPATPIASPLPDVAEAPAPAPAPASAPSPTPAPVEPAVPIEPAEPVTAPETLVTAVVEPVLPRPPYRPAPGKLERIPVVPVPDNAPLPSTTDPEPAAPVPAPEPAPSPAETVSVPQPEPQAPPQPESQSEPEVLPAETGSIETPVVPAVEALVEPEHIALPQLPPPPLAPELSQPLVPSAPPLTEVGIAPAPVPTPVPTTTPLPEPERLADQPLPSSALPPPVAVAPAPPPAAPAPADSAAAAATAIADPLPPAVPAAPPPAVVVAPSVPVAEVSPIPPDPKPDVTATPPVDPTIDTIAFDLTGTVVAGDGPQGAVIHLYVDAELAGEGAVLDGRWEIFGAPLFVAPSQTLRAVAIDPETGRVIGETEISIELELPESAAPPALEDPVADEIVPPRPGPDRIAAADPPPELPTPVAPVAAPAPELATAPPVETAPVETSPLGTAPAAPGPKVLPPLRTVVPRGESASVTILPESRSKLTDSPGTGFAILGD